MGPILDVYDDDDDDEDFITVVESVYSAVGADSLYKADYV